MTVAIGFLCKDGIVLGADSMLTPTVGHLNVGHHKGVKIQTLDREQVFAFAGDMGQAARLRSLCDRHADLTTAATDPLGYPLALSAAIIEQFTKTGIRNAISVSALLGFVFEGGFQLCAFEEDLQPRLLDKNHYYVALGSGKLAADPFLRFLVDIFCVDGPPTLAKAVWLTTWIIDHVCLVSPGGVAPPVRICVIEQVDGGEWRARSLDPIELDDHRQFITSAGDALRTWQNDLSSKPLSEASSTAPPIPKMPIDED